MYGFHLPIAPRDLTFLEIRLCRSRGMRLSGMIDDTPQSMAADLHKRMARMDISDDLEPTPQTARG
jgi:hypothetical protein